MNHFSEIIGHFGFETFRMTTDSCGITTATTFSCGSPAMFYLSRTPQGKYLFDDYALNYGSFCDSLPDPDQAVRTMQRLVKDSSTLVKVDHRRIIAEADHDSLVIVFGEYLGALSRLASYKPKTMDHQRLEDIMACICAYLSNEFKEKVEAEPKIGGQSGCEHSFAFRVGNTLVDYAAAKKNKTGSLLRKIIDVQNRDESFVVTVIVDDSDQESFKRETGILSTVASVLPSSRLTMH